MAIAKSTDPSTKPAETGACVPKAGAPATRKALCAVPATKTKAGCTVATLAAICEWKPTATPANPTGPVVPACTINPKI